MLILPSSASLALGTFIQQVDSQERGARKLILIPTYLVCHTDRFSKQKAEGTQQAALNLMYCLDRLDEIEAGVII